MPLLPSPTNQQYTLVMNPEMDHDIEQLERRLGKDRSEVFLSALRLYATVKEQQLQYSSCVILQDPSGKNKKVIPDV